MNQGERMTARLPFGVASLLMLASCAATPMGDRRAAGCPIVTATGWAAWVNAMPGPNRRAALIVTGRVTVPTGGYRPHLALEQVAESYPVHVFVRLHPNPPAGPATQALVTQDVRGEWPMSPPVGSVTIRCGSQVLARISPVETTY